MRGPKSRTGPSRLGMDVIDEDLDVLLSLHKSAGNHQAVHIAHGINGAGVLVSLTTVPSGR